MFQGYQFTEKAAVYSSFNFGEIWRGASAANVGIGAERRKTIRESEATFAGKTVGIPGCRQNRDERRR